MLRAGLISLQLFYPGWYEDNELILSVFDSCHMHNYFVYRGIEKDCTSINSEWILTLISIMRSQFQISENMSQWLFRIEKELSNL